MAEKTEVLNLQHPRRVSSLAPLAPADPRNGSIETHLPMNPVRHLGGGDFTLGNKLHSHLEPRRRVFCNCGQEGESAPALAPRSPRRLRERTLDLAERAMAESRDYLVVAVVAPPPAAGQHDPRVLSS